MPADRRSILDADRAADEATRFVCCVGRAVQRHPRATFRIGAVAVFVAAVGFVISTPDRRALVVLAAATSLLWVACRVGRPVHVEPEPVEPPATLVTFRPPLRLLAPAPPPVDDLHRLVIGSTVDGATPWTVNLLGSSLFAAGLPGSGKSAFLRALLESLSPWVGHGEVELRGFDPKLVEFHLAAPMFTHLWTPEGESDEQWGLGAAQLLESSLAEMQSRLLRMKARRDDDLEPTVEEPHIVHFVDEVASLLAPRPNADPKIAKRIAGALDRIVREGRAPKLSVVIATQEPRKNMIDMRDNISERVCFRVAASSYGDMVLYDGAAHDGIRPDRIKRSEPGVAYAMVDGEALRVRAHLLRKDELETLARRCPAPRQAA